MFCQVFNKGYKDKLPTFYSTIYIKVEKTWKKYKDTIQKILQSMFFYIYISLNIWTSPNQYLLLAIYIYFILYKHKKSKVLLAFKRVPGYSGIDQFSILFPLLADYSVVYKLGAIIANNISPNNIFCYTIEFYIKENKKIK